MKFFYNLSKIFSLNKINKAIVLFNILQSQVKIFFSQIPFSNHCIVLVWNGMQGGLLNTYKPFYLTPGGWPPNLFIKEYQHFTKKYQHFTKEYYHLIKEYQHFTKKYQHFIKEYQHLTKQGVLAHYQEYQHFTKEYQHFTKEY